MLYPNPYLSVSMPRFMSLILYYFINLVFKNSLKILLWNCRGLSGVNTFIRICLLLRKHRPSIVYLVESRVDPNQVNRLCSKFSRRWDWAAIGVEGFFGGIIVMWYQHIGMVIPLAFSRISMNLVITSNARETCLLYLVYNGQRIKFLRLLWKELSRMSNLNLPWIIMADFNYIILPNEHKGGHFYYYSCKAHLFSDFILTNTPFDLGIIGFFSLDE